MKFSFVFANPFERQMAAADYAKALSAFVQDGDVQRLKRKKRLLASYLKVSTEVQRILIACNRINEAVEANRKAAELWEIPGWMAPFALVAQCAVDSAGEGWMEKGFDRQSWEQFQSRLADCIQGDEEYPGERALDMRYGSGIVSELNSFHSCGQFRNPLLVRFAVLGTLIFNHAVLDAKLLRKTQSIYPGMGDSASAKKWAQRETAYFWDVNTLAYDQVCMCRQAFFPASFDRRQKLMTQSPSESAPAAQKAGQG